jgi:hypothetical protein
MNANGPCRITSLLIVLPILLNAQLARQHDPVALKHWLAPLYWQPAQGSAEEHAVATAANATGLPANATPLVFVAMPPCRVVDTRTIGQGLTGAFGPPSLAAGAVRTFPVLSSTTCTIPAVALAYSFEITVVPPGPLTYLTAFPTGQSAPVAAITVESPQGFMASNTGIIPAGTNGSVDVYATNPTDIVIDINGYYAPLTTGTNTALGTLALANNTTGVTNTAIGVDALEFNTTGYGNTAIGVAALLNNTTGGDNTASGVEALSNNTTGAGNTASGAGALYRNTTGSNNTASGVSALSNNTTGNNNTASGVSALQSNTTGSYNTASGAQALLNNTTGNDNTASGFSALEHNTTGMGSTALGLGALENNTTGGGNTASGVDAMVSNTTGNNNTATGDAALSLNTVGYANTAAGGNAMVSNTTGSGNTATGTGSLALNNGSNNTANGVGALSSITAGNNNIAIGYLAASNVAGGNSNNIHIGSQGAASDSGTIRIGDSSSQTSFFVVGVRGITTGANNAIPVVIDSNGQLGTVSSSRRFKEDIHDMDTASSGLMRLRPVTFRYQKPFADGSKPIQYGLIAEEVAEVYPDLVARSADGQIETVKYQVLDSMLLNELQKEHAQVQQQAETIQRLESRLAALEEALRSGK